MMRDKARTRTILQAFLIVLITVLAYIPAMRGGFIWDDTSALVNNPRFQDARGLYRFWFSTDFQDYWPFTYTTLWIEWRIWGAKPAGYHAVNILLHALCSVLVWRILRRLEVPWAWWVGTFFAVHPVNVAAVAWIIQRKTVLAGALYFASLLCFLRFDKERKHGMYWAAIGLYCLALLSKSSVIMLPFVLLGYAWWRRGRVALADVLRSLPFFILTLLVASVSFSAHHRIAVGTEFVRTEGFLSRLAGAGWIVWFYLIKAIVPYKLVFVYPYWHIDGQAVRSYLPGIGLLIALGVFWRYRRGWGRAPLAALGYFVLTLAPVLGFINISYMHYSLVADHYQYLSIGAVIALVAGGLSAAIGRRWSVSRTAQGAIGTCFVGALFILTWRQEAIYTDNETIWRRTLADNPSAWVAHHELGIALAGRGRHREAAEQLALALRGRPDDVVIHENLAVAFANQGLVDAAVTEYLWISSRRPDNPEVHKALGDLLLKKGDLRQSAEQYQRALQLNPDWPRVANNLAWILATSADAGLRNGVEAVRLARIAARASDGNDAQVLDTLAAAYAEAGRFDEAAAAANKAVSVAASAGQRAVADEIAGRLSLYRARRPYHGVATQATMPVPR